MGVAARCQSAACRNFIQRATPGRTTRRMSIFSVPIDKQFRRTTWWSLLLSKALERQGDNGQKRLIVNAGADV